MEKYLWKEADLPEKELMPGVWLKSIYREDHLVTIVTFKPFARVPRHSHDQQQISVVIEGKMNLNIEGESVTAHKGDIVVVPPHTPHSVDVSARGAKVVETWSTVVSEYVLPQGQAGTADGSVESEAPPGGGDEPSRDMGLPGGGLV